MNKLQPISWFVTILILGWFGFLLVNLINCSARKQGRITHIGIHQSSSLGKIEKNVNYQGGGGTAKIVTAEGRAEILESGEQVAYERAKEHAFRNAIERVLGTLLVADTKVVNAALVEDVIYAYSSGFVEKYQILAEHNVGKVKFLSLRAWVVAQDLEESVLVYRVLQSRIGLPRVALWVHRNIDLEPEIRLESVIESVEVTLAEVLIQKKFLIVNEAIREEFFNLERSSRTARMQIVASQNVDMVMEVILSADENDLTNNKYLKGRSLRSVTIELGVRVYNAESGAILVSSTETAAGVGLHPTGAALQASLKALSKLHPLLIKRMFAYWAEQLQEGSLYEISIQDITPLEGMTIRKRLTSRYIEGIVDVFDRGFTAGKQTFTVRYLGKLEEIIPFILAPQKIPVPLKLVKYSPRYALFKKF